MEKILALPKYRHLGELPGYNGHPGGTTLYPSDPGSIKLISRMYKEFLPLFQAEDFNICGDEPWELGKGRSKRQAKKLGVGKVYLNFILKIHKLCQKYGKRMNMWADIVLTHPEIIPAIPKDIVMLNWDYYPEGKWMRRTNEIVDAGLSVVCCPGTHGWQSHGSRMKHAINNVARFSRIARKYAAEGLLNTDWGDFGHRNTLGVSLHGFAHGAACAGAIQKWIINTSRNASASISSMIRKANLLLLYEYWGQRAAITFTTHLLNPLILQNRCRWVALLATNPVS